MPPGVLKRCMRRHAVAGAYKPQACCAHALDVV